MGAQFGTKVIKEMCMLLQIQKIHTTPCHSQRDDLVERLNHTIQNMLATDIDYKSEWGEYLPKVCLAYNTNKHSTTEFAAFYQANMPLDVIYGTPIQTSKHHFQYTTDLQKTFEQAYQTA